MHIVCKLFISVSIHFLFKNQCVDFVSCYAPYDNAQAGAYMFTIHICTHDMKKGLLSIR